MDEGIDFNDLPIKVPIWNSSVSKNLKIAQNRYGCDLLPDFGGSGVDVKFNGYSTSQKHLKINSLRTATFHPKCCCLPIVSQWNRWRHCLPSVRIPEYFPNSSCLDFDEHLSCVLYTDVSRQKVIVSEYVEKEFDVQNMSIPSVFEISSHCVDYDSFDEEDGLIREVIASTNVYGSRVAIVKQASCLTFIEIVKDEVNDEINLSTLLKIDLSKVGRNQKLFQFAVCNELMPGFVAIAGQVEGSSRNEVAFLVEYDINEDKVSWKSKQEWNFKYPIGLHQTSHPRIVAYGETRQFGVVDMRMKNRKCFSSVISREEIGSINQWEKFRLISNNPSKDNQHLVATDCHLCVCDIRFPKGVVLQWTHGVNSEDSLNFLKSSKNLICDISGNAVNSHKIAVANQCDICLFSTKSLEDSINPFSLHPPLHVSKPIDCYYFSETGDADIYDHITDTELIGLKVLNWKCGFSLYQMTNKGDVFVQDFYHKDESDRNEADFSWRYSMAPKELKLPKEVVDFISDTFKVEEENKQDMNDEKHVRVCECCEIVCKLRDEDFFGRCTSHLNVMSNGELVNATFLDIGDQERKKMKRKHKKIVKVPPPNSTDDHIKHLTDTFLPDEVETHEMEVDSAIEDGPSRAKIELPLRTKIIDIWKE